eukprot:TRINITY_DN30032_c0_g1_i1.p2 TRINITY_DN30032_c0_g1~~TRINITY_DN30032_c0_g1_i1.p2  ORF type:complete len:260 (+),score=35.15 TRINITY_DN30032_c0_g1_i1:40-780(+)
MFASLRGAVTQSLVRSTCRKAPPAGVLQAALVQDATPALLVSRRWGHNVKAPGVPWVTYHPHVPEPENKLRIKAQTGLAKFVPKNYRHQQYVESIRSGEFLGQDWPYKNLGHTFWKARRYNVDYHPIPHDMSTMTGVKYVSRLHLWQVEWTENEIQRFHGFRAQFGFNKAKYIAEDFRRKMVAAGRVDNRRTDRQTRLKWLSGEEARKIRKKKFAVKDSRRKGNSGSKLGRERRIREAYRRRGLLP